MGKDTEKMIRVSTFLDPEDKAEAEVQAAKRGLALSTLLRTSLLEWLRRHK